MVATLSLMILLPIYQLESNDTPSIDFASVKFTEIDYNGYTSFTDSTTSSTQEAIEITNTSNLKISVHNWQLRFVSGSTDKVILLPNVTIDPGEIFVFVRGLDIPIHLKGMVYTGALDNTKGAFLELRDNNGITIDSFNSYGAWPIELASNTDSLQLYENEWQSCPESIGETSSCALGDDETSTPIPDDTVEEEPNDGLPDPDNQDDGGEEEIIREEPNDNLPITLPPSPPDLIDYTLRINEILPNPIGIDSTSEFVELYNYGAKDIDLSMLQLDDILNAGSSAQNLEGVIKAKSFFTIQGSNLKISLNNSGDEVHLIEKNTKRIIDSLKYGEEEVIEGKSIGYIQGVLQILENPSPNKENIPNIIPDKTSPAPVDVLTPPQKEEKPTEFEIKKGNILINEIFPNPVGDDAEYEYIELENTSLKAISLDGWKLKINSRQYTFKNETIQAGELIVIMREKSKFTLPNIARFTVELLSPHDEIYDSVTVSDQLAEFSYAKHQGAWFWTSTPSPEEANLITPPEVRSQQISKTNSPLASHLEVGLHEVREQEHNVKIFTEGLVIRDSKPNHKYVYIMGKETIIKVYSPKKQLSSLRIGDYISVKGTWFTTENNEYVRIKEFSSDISILSKKRPPDVIPMKTLDIQEPTLFQTVTLTGRVDGQSAKSWYLETDDAMNKVELAKDLSLKKPKFTKGDIMTVTGFIDIENGVKRIVIENENLIVLDAKDSQESSDSSQDEEVLNDENKNLDNKSLADIIQSSMFTALPFGFSAVQGFFSSPLVLGAVFILSIIASIFIVKKTAK